MSSCSLSQVPVPVTAKRQQFLAIRSLVESASDKHKYVRIWDSLSAEVLAAYNNEVQSYT